MSEPKNSPTAEHCYLCCEGVDLRDKKKGCQGCECEHMVSKPLDAVGTYIHKCSASWFGDTKINPSNDELGQVLVALIDTMKMCFEQIEKTGEKFTYTPHDLKICPACDLIFKEKGGLCPACTPK